MPFTPKFTITTKIASDLMRIEAARSALQHRVHCVPVPLQGTRNYPKPKPRVALEDSLALG
jgi:hypothetical protein